MTRYKPLNQQLQKVLDKVASNIREKHIEGATVGRVRRVGVNALQINKMSKGIKYTNFVHGDFEDEETLDNP